MLEVILWHLRSHAFSLRLFWVGGRQILYTGQLDNSWQQYWLFIQFGFIASKLHRTTKRKCTEYLQLGQYFINSSHLQIPRLARLSWVGSGPNAFCFEFLQDAIHFLGLPADRHGFSRFAHSFSASRYFWRQRSAKHQRSRRLRITRVAQPQSTNIHPWPDIENLTN